MVMPFISTIALQTLYPLIGDYITTFTVAHAAVVSACITGYAWCFSGLLKRTYSLSRLPRALITGLFLIFHFLVFRTKDWNNTYLFSCEDLNCYYNYLIPALLNASLVMVMMGNAKFDHFMKNGDPAVKGLFYVVVYLAIFSNMVDSGILAAFAGCQLLLHLIQERKTFRLKDYVKKNAIYLLILLAWFISAVFELSGGRASSTSSHGLLPRIQETLYLLKDVLVNCNMTFWLCVMLICLGAVFCFLSTRKKQEDEHIFLSGILTCIIAGAALVVYMLILCAQIWSYNIYRSEYLFPLFFLGFILVFWALGYLIKKQPKLLTVMPLLLVFLVSTINTNNKTFEDSLMSDYSPAVCADISRDILEQFLAADEAGLTEMTLYVPMHVADPETEDNWPHSLVLIPRIGAALYEQGLISQPIELTVVADPAVNQRHNIPIPAAE